MTCACGDKISAEAKDDKEAVGALLKAGVAHIETCPKGEMFKSMSEADLTNMVKSNMVAVG